MATLTHTLQALAKAVASEPVSRRPQLIRKYRRRIVQEILATTGVHHLAFYLGIKLPQEPQA